MWREEQSPYRVIELNEEQDRVYRNLLRAIDPGCFRNANAAFVSEHRDTQIICESIAVNATMLMTSNMRSIDRERVNEWAINNGDRLGFAAEPVVQWCILLRDLRTFVSRGVQESRGRPLRRVSLWVSAWVSISGRLARPGS